MNTLNLNNFRQFNAEEFILSIRHKYCRNKNSYVKHLDHALLEVINSRNEVCISLIDIDMVYEVSKYNWSFRKTNGRFYIYRNLHTPNTKTEFLHQFLMKGKKSIDHKNGNSLDNRLCNLRECDRFQNMANVEKIRSDKKSQLPRGVYKHSDGRYRTFIHHKNVKIEIGVFDIAEEAFENYKKKHLELNKEFSPYTKGGIKC